MIPYVCSRCGAHTRLLAFHQCIPKSFDQEEE